MRKMCVCGATVMFFSIIIVSFSYHLVDLVVKLVHQASNTKYNRLITYLYFIVLVVQFKSV